MTDDNLTITDLAHSLVDGAKPIADHATLAATLERLDAQGVSLAALARAIRLDWGSSQPTTCQEN